MSISEITPSAVKIDKLIARVADGDIKIPAFQRRFVWDQEQVMELLDSIYHDFPIGSILLWTSDEKLKATRNICGFSIPDRPESYPVNYVLDGQQRLSTIYAVFCKDRTQETNGNGATDLDSFDIYFNLDKEAFQPGNESAQGCQLFPLKSLFDFTAFMDTIAQTPQRYHEAVKKLHLKFNNYEVPIVTITKRSKDEVGIIFERINNTGTKLTALDLMVAWTWSDNFHLSDQIAELLETLDQKGFGEIPDKTILQCLGAIIAKKTSTRAVLELKPQDVQDKFPLLTSSLEKAIDFLSTQLNASKDFLPHIQQLVGLAYFFSQIDAPSKDQTKWIKQWFWKTSFSRRYSGQTDEKMDADILLFEQFIKNNADGLGRYNYTVNDTTLIKQKFVRSNPLVRAFLLLLSQNQPVDLVNGARVDLGKALSKFNSKEYHHIFPRAHLKARKFPQERVNSLCNFCFLTSDSNKKISNKAPSDYFKDVVPQDRFADILQANLMPLNRDIYDRDEYEEFLKQRSQLIMQFLDRQLI